MVTLLTLILWSSALLVILLSIFLLTYIFLRQCVFCNLKLNIFLETLLHFFGGHYSSYLSETRCKLTFFVSAIVLRKRKCFQSDIGVMIAVWMNCAF